MVDTAGSEMRNPRKVDSPLPRRPRAARFRRVARGAALALSLVLACAAEGSAVATPPGPAPRAAAIAPASPDTVSLGSGSLEAGLDSDVAMPPAFLEGGSVPLWAVATEVNRHLGDLQQCYERRLLANPGLSGEVVMHWNITAAGNVAEQCVTQDTVGDEDVLSCVNALVRDSRFPASHGPVSVTFPFVFGATP